MSPPPSDEEDPIPPEPGEDETVIVDPEPPDITHPTGGGTDRASTTFDGEAVTIIAERVEYLDEDGKLVTESLRDYSKKALREALRQPRRFPQPLERAERKQAIIEELESEGLLLEPLAEEVGKDLDPFDLICHVAFDQPPLTRRERADNVRKRDVFTKYGAQARAVLEALLQKYQDEGVTEPRRSAHPAGFAVRRDGHAGRAGQNLRRTAPASRGPSTNCNPPSIREQPNPMSVRNTVKSIQDIMRQDVGVDGDAQRISQLCWMFFLKIIDDQDQELELMQDGYRSPIPKKFQWRTWAADPEGITGDELLTFVNDELFPTLKELPGTGQGRTAAASSAMCSRTPTTT